MSASPRTGFLTPDLHGFTKPGDDTKCLNGADRPCAALLRAEPDIAGETVLRSTVTGDRRIYGWPLEHYGSTEGDAAEILCAVRGRNMNDYIGGTATKKWYVVRVPFALVNNSTKLQAESADPPFGVEKDADGKITAVDAYGSAKWFEDSRQTDLSTLPECTAVQNPKQYSPFPDSNCSSCEYVVRD